jgi:hypothetical protein
MGSDTRVFTSSSRFRWPAPTRQHPRNLPPAGRSFQQLQNRVAASRILADQGVVDAFGHVSIRHPTNPNHYLVSRAAPAVVTADDIMEFRSRLGPARAAVRVVEEQRNACRLLQLKLLSFAQTVQGRRPGVQQLLELLAADAG